MILIPLLWIKDATGHNIHEIDRQCTCNVNLMRFHETIVALKGNEYHIFLCVCVCVRERVCLCAGAWARAFSCTRVALLVQYAKRMHHFVSCVPSNSTNFSTLSHKWYDLRKKLLNLKYVFLFSLQLSSKTILILRGIQ